MSFDQDIYVKNFEITIRMLGGLLSSYQLTGDKRLLALADDLGKRLLPAFNSPTGLPYVYVNLKTGAVRGVETNPAEAGTLLLEFGTLSKLTGKPVYYDKAKRALVEVYNRRSADRAGRRQHQRRDRQVDRHRLAHQRRHRFLLRVPVQGVEALRRRRLPAHVEGEHHVHQSVSGR